MTEHIIGTDAPLNERQRENLSLVLDMIVPASDDGRKPSAREVDVLGYIQRHEGETVPTLCVELDRLDAAAEAAFARPFASVEPPDRIKLVDDMRTREPNFLRALALQTVTCYYQDDRVVGALGLEARPPFPDGYAVAAGDLSLLEPVRARGKRYRDA